MRYSPLTQSLDGLGSDKWAVHVRAKQRRLAGEDIIQLTIGEPDVPTPPELIEATCQALRAGRTGYSGGRGEPIALQAIADKYAARSGRPVGPDQVIYLPGAQNALYLAMRGVAGPGDEVLVGDPLYATYEGVIVAAGATCAMVPLAAEHGFHLRAEELEQAVTPSSRALLLNSPHNPTGAVLSKDEIGAIGEVCRRHDLWIISDEVYESLCYGADFASPFDDAALAERTLVVSSLSKSHAAAGFRAGWCVSPAEFSRRILPLAETMMFGAQPFISDAAAFALSRSFPETEIMRQAYGRRAGLLHDRLSGAKGLNLIMPQGGMFAMLDIRGLGISSERFANRLLDELNVGVMPGEAFGEQAAGLVRISLTAPDEALAKAATAVRQLSERILALNPAKTPVQA